MNIAERHLSTEIFHHLAHQAQNMIHSGKYPFIVFFDKGTVVRFLSLNTTLTENIFYYGR